MPGFLARHRAAVVLSAVFLLAWVIAMLATRADRPGPEDPDRWVHGPAPISGAVGGESADAGDASESD